MGKKGKKKDPAHDKSKPEEQQEAKKEATPPVAKQEPSKKEVPPAEPKPKKEKQPKQQKPETSKETSPSLTTETTGAKKKGKKEEKKHVPPPQTVEVLPVKQVTPPKEVQPEPAPMPKVATPKTKSTGGKNRRGGGKDPAGRSSQQPQGRGQPSMGRGQVQGRGQTPPPGFEQQAMGRGQTPTAWGRSQQQIRGMSPPQQMSAMQQQSMTSLQMVRGQPPMQIAQGIAALPGMVQYPAQPPMPQQQKMVRGQVPRQQPMIWDQRMAQPQPQQIQQPTTMMQPAGSSGERVTAPPGMQPKQQKGKQIQRRGKVGDGRGPPAQQQAQPAQPSQPASVTTIAKGMEALSIEMKERKDTDKMRGGTIGRRINIETNHLPMHLEKLVPVAYHYDVTMTPDKPKRMLRSAWEAYRRQYIPRIFPAFDDSKNAYSTTKIPQDLWMGEVVVNDDNDRPKTFKVQLKYANDVNMMALTDYFRQKGRGKPQDALQCLDIVLRNASALRFVRVQRSFFSQPKGRIIDLGNGMELWHGYFQSAILGWKPYLNVDIANKGFPKEMNVVDLMAEISRQPAKNMDEIDFRSTETISKHLKSLKIRYEIPRLPSSKRTIRVNALASGNAIDTKFVDQNGVQDTVYNYFAKLKNYKIQYPKLPLVWVGPRDRKLYYPAELCTILPGQVTQKKLDDIQTREMIKNAATSTVVRKNKIMEAIERANLNQNDVVKAFGISIASQFAQVTARILPPPKLTYATGDVQPSRGIWRGDKFIMGKELINWKVLNLSRFVQNKNIDYFCDSVERIGAQYNMRISKVTQPYDFIQNVREIRHIQQYFEKNKNGVQLIFVIVPDRQSDVYAKVKQQAELVVGCLTQCIKDRTLQRINPTTVVNILLKVNAKLNGINHQISNVSRPKCLLQPCMIMGADVNHPSPEMRDRPSYAAVTASHDPRAFQYNICWRLQPSTKEIILDLQNIVVEHLKFFYEQTNRKPETIIFFRDGVSEGFFQEVLNNELQAIRKACHSLNQGYEPKITFLVVQKRHHTRFFPRASDSEDKNQNVPAGTCVDTDIIHPSDIEYYLVSHASIQGVARPTKYRMLWDDNDMSDDEIQSLTYYLCHMFTRCNRSVSYPAPTYYAHLAAARAHTYFEGKTINMNDLTREQEKHKTIIRKDNPMFFV